MLNNKDADSFLADGTATKVLATYRRLLKNDSFGLDDNFFDSGGHSLLAMVLALELESELGLPVGLERIFGRPTVRELCASLKESVSAGPATVLSLTGARASHTIYFIHAAFEFSPLCEALSPEIAASFVTINDRRWLRQVMAENDTLNTLDIISDAYADAILPAHRGGPVCLAGHSAGGIFALETVRKLEQRGVTADTIFLFDTYLHSSLQRAVYDVLNNGWGIKKIRSLLRACVNGLSAVTRNSSKSSVSAVQSENTASDAEFGSLLSQLRDRTSEAYRGPKCAPGCRTVLFQATRTADGRARRIDPDLGWAAVLETNLSVTPVAADHFNMIKDPHASYLAAKIKCMTTTADKSHAVLPTEHSES
jgi:thioesterase domain-containing protein/acyl carrier protein